MSAQMELSLLPPSKKIWIRPAALSNPGYADAFWARVEKWPGRGPKGDCWEWTGFVDPSPKSGYGIVVCDGKVQRAHRVAWQITRGPIPIGLQVLHSCDHRPCVNPAHLFLGTNLDNVQDKVRKGRHPRGLEAAMYSNPRRGSDNWHSRFSDEQILAMRAMYAAGAKCVEVARKFEVKGHICNMILHGRRWAHLPGALPLNRRMAKNHIDKIRPLIKKGMRTCDIARAVGFSEAAILRLKKQVEA